MWQLTPLQRRVQIKPLLMTSPLSLQSLAFNHQHEGPKPWCARAAWVHAVWTILALPRKLETKTGLLQVDTIAIGESQFKLIATIRLLGTYLDREIIAQMRSVHVAIVASAVLLLGATRPEATSLAEELERLRRKLPRPKRSLWRDRVALYVDAWRYGNCSAFSMVARTMHVGSHRGANGVWAVDAAILSFGCSASGKTCFLGFLGGKSHFPFSQLSDAVFAIFHTPCPN